MFSRMLKKTQPTLAQRSKVITDLSQYIVRIKLPRCLWQSSNVINIYKLLLFIFLVILTIWFLFSRPTAVVFPIMRSVFMVGGKKKDHEKRKCLKPMANLARIISGCKAVEIEYFVFITTAEEGKGKDSGQQLLDN